MKLILFVFSIFAFLSSQLYAEPLRISYFVASPHVVIEKGGKLSGAAVKFFSEKLASEMGVNAVWAKDPVSVPRQMQQAKEGKLDMTLVFAKNPERETIFNFPKNNFYQSNPAIALQVNSPINKIEKVDDILSVKIGYGQSAVLTPFMRDKRINFEFISGGDWIHTNFKKLIAGRVDGFYQPERTTLLYFGKLMNVEDKIKIVNLPEETKLFVAFSKKTSKDLVDRYDAAFQKAGGTKAYLKYLAEYIDINKL